MPRLLTLVLLFWTAFGEDPWRFITIADWHGAEPFATKPILSEKDLNKISVKVKVDAIKHIKENYGGELVVLPGDAEAGKWYKSSLLRALNVATPEEAVRKAGEQCYNGMKIVFEEAGYPELLMAVGDHEIGGNPWVLGDLKTNLVPTFREAFYEGFNMDTKGRFRYSDPIGKAESRPVGTIFKTTSFAYRHKNVLFVTVDVYDQLDDNFLDTERGRGGAGAITCDVTGRHLQWFESVLSEGRKDKTIKHIIVQAHPPIMQPVRKVRCTGQFLDGAEDSAFFKVMEDYDVDLYLAGEVHANTATKAKESNVVQIVSRGNAVENFLTMDITDDAISVTQYNEIETERRSDREYEFYGQLIIDKSGAQTIISSRGSLELLDRQQPMIRFTFDEMSTLLERPVLALTHDDIQTSLIQSSITFNGVECRGSFPNVGAYGQPYDAQVGHVVLRNGVKGKAALLNATSQIAVFGYGPHSGGLKVSYSLWFKTARDGKNQVLLHFGEVYSAAAGSRNPAFSLTLNKGMPVLYAGIGQTLSPSGLTKNLADNKWHHIAVSMPRNSCRLSEVDMYVDGARVTSKVEGKDGRLFFTTSGSVSIGGFGHSHPNFYQKVFRGHVQFVGLIDEVYVWADSLTRRQIARLSKATSGSTRAPTAKPTISTRMPSSSPTLAATPTATPTMQDTPIPTLSPTLLPSLPTMSPTEQDLSKPQTPSPEPTALPTDEDPEGQTVDFTVYRNFRCKLHSIPKWYNLEARPCRRNCLKRKTCLGYFFVVRDGISKCGHLTTAPERGLRLEGAICAIKKIVSRQPTDFPSIPPISFTVHANYRCDMTSRPKWYDLDPMQCEEKCIERIDDCLGYFSVVREGSYKCGHYSVTPQVGVRLEGAACAIRDDAPLPETPASSPFLTYTNYRCQAASPPKWYNLDPNLCEEKCIERINCLGYFSVLRDGSYKCGHYDVAPKPGGSLENSICAIKT